MTHAYDDRILKEEVEVRSQTNKVGFVVGKAVLGQVFL
jgi:hypothetical protein